MKKQLLAWTIASILFSGCASMDRGSRQELSVETQNNANVEGTSCVVTNDDGKWTTQPSRTIHVERDAAPMNVKCENNAQSGTSMVSPEFANKYILQNVIWDFCTISCLIDGFSGAFYEYPHYVYVDMVKR